LQNCLDFTENGSGLGAFNSSLTGLNDGTTYYVSAYATNEIGTSYGEVKTFNTIEITIPDVTTFEVSNVTQNSAECGGNVTSNGNGTVIARGVCWNTTGDPTLTNCINYTTNGSGTGNFTSNITELQENTIYYVAAYATNEKGTAYGLIKQFNTTIITVPIVVTANVINISTNSAQCGGNVTNNGNGKVSARGVCWNTNGNPTLGNCLGYTTDGSGLGSYTSNITGLSEGTTYYVSAYATNEEGTGYGTTKQFTTIAITMPVVITADVTNITSDSAQCGGDVTSNGNGTVSARGVCWNTTGNPTLANCDGYTTDGSGLGTYISYLTDLDENTLYYVTAYATNEEGTAYGDIESFTTLLSFTCGDQISYSGQDYNTVLIGAQCWIIENLNIGTRIDGVDEQTDNSIIEKYCYDDDENNCDEYGGLYQWDEMMQYITDTATQGICPDGWHIPTDFEWKVLEGTVDSQYPVGDPEWDGTGYRGFDAGKNLKSTSGWYSNGNGTNDYGFNARPGGSRYDDGSFHGLGIGASFSTSSDYDGVESWKRRLYYGSDEINRLLWDWVYGQSVRCLKD
jgi:uncharacterized protein (TIGR02145 family)